MTVFLLLTISLAGCSKEAIELKGEEDTTEPERSQLSYETVELPEGVCWIAGYEGAVYGGVRGQD